MCHVGKRFNKWEDVLVGGEVIWRDGRKYGG